MIYFAAPRVYVAVSPRVTHHDAGPDACRRSCGTRRRWRWRPARASARLLDQVMSAGRFLLRRALFALLLVFVVSSGAFLLTRLAPGNGGRFEHRRQSRGLRRARRAELGLDRPIAAQYLDWLAASPASTSAARSCSRDRWRTCCTSARSTRPCSPSWRSSARRSPAFRSGIYTGSHPRGLLPKLLRGVSLVLLSIPPLIGSLLLVLVAARTGWFPIGGMTSAAAGDGTWGAVARGSRASRAAAGARARGCRSRPRSSGCSRSRSTTAVGEPFVRAALARGISPEQRGVAARVAGVARRRCSGLYGVAIGSLFSGSFVVEVVTAWPGLGRLMYDALRAPRHLSRRRLRGHRRVLSRARHVSRRRDAGRSSIRGGARAAA